MKHFIPYEHQWVDKADIDAMVKVLKSDWMTQGPIIEEFENAIAKFCGAKYAVAVSSGTAALHAAFWAAGIGPGDEVITTPITFAATSNAVVYCGGTPVFAEIKEDTLNIDPKEIEKKITKRTKAIAPVDFTGEPVDLDEILAIARKHKLLVIEDAAHSFASQYKGRKIGSIADMTIFSFHPVKTITTGEGGMVVTNNKKFYEKMRIFRHHGLVREPAKGGWYQTIERPGYNYRITDFQCALGLSQLKKLPKFVARRHEIAERYQEAFKGMRELVLPAKKTYTKPVLHIFVVQLRLEKLAATRRQIFDALKSEGIGVQVHYVPLHMHPFYQKKFGYRKGDFPVAERYYERAITLPIFPGMTPNEVKTVIEKVQKVIKIYGV